ncbi:hypothetical protein LC593_32705, partial [Nostoc sp. CHAB 5844]|nr:hypothetical protein [Nostoc sp. CHAB 5844]
MCKLIGYLGNSIQLDELLYKQEHSLYRVGRRHRCLFPPSEPCVQVSKYTAQASPSATSVGDSIFSA